MPSPSPSLSAAFSSPVFSVGDAIVETLRMSSGTNAGGRLQGVCTPNWLAHGVHTVRCVSQEWMTHRSLLRFSPTVLTVARSTDLSLVEGMPNRWVVRVVAAAAAVTTAGGSTGAHDGSTAGLGQSLGLDFGQTDITGTTDQSAETDTATLIRELQRKIAQLRERSSRDGCESTPSPRKQPSTPSKGILSGELRKALPCTPVPCVPQPCVPGPDEGKEVLDDQAPGPMSRLVTWMFAWATWWNFSLGYVLWIVGYYAAASKGYTVESLIPDNLRSGVEPELRGSLYEKHRARELRKERAEKGPTEGLVAEDDEPNSASVSRQSSDTGNTWASKSPHRSRTSTDECYVVTAKTQDVKHGGTDGRVFIVLHGHLRTSPEVELKHVPKKDRRKNGRHTFAASPHTVHTAFHRGALNHFRLPFEDVGYIQAISVRLVSRQVHLGGHLPGHGEWHPEYVKVTTPDGTEFKFQCDTPISKHDTQMLPLTETTAEAAPDVNFGEHINLLSQRKDTSPDINTQLGTDFDDTELLEFDDTELLDARLHGESEDNDDVLSSSGTRRFRQSRTLGEDDVVEVKPIFVNQL
eukprot:m.107875 g.107875  ORF g.107875 m.107875 type:complete len:579 (+) comp12779_c0_seq1:4175-5911(+)